MLVVGLTGGIGSGKTTVANMFSTLGIPVYIADEESKKLLVTSKVIKRKLINLFGEDTYNGNELNKPFIADKIFNNKTLLQKMNAIVHPKVAQHFKSWLTKQEGPYVIKESAILFESGAYETCDLILTITAPKKLRIERVMQRDSVSEEKVLNIIKNQWTEEEKIKYSNYVIVNKKIEDTQQKVLEIHRKILENNAQS